METLKSKEFILGVCGGIILVAAFLAAVCYKKKKRGRFASFENYSDEDN